MVNSNNIINKKLPVNPIEAGYCNTVVGLVSFDAGLFYVVLDIFSDIDDGVADGGIQTELEKEVS